MALIKAVSLLVTMINANAYDNNLFQIICTAVPITINGRHKRMILLELGEA